MKSLCVQCGTRPAESMDHIPPKNLFARPRPNNLITVPSCNRCNQGSSDDDEYFRFCCSIRHDTAEHPNAAKVWPTALRGLVKPQKRRMHAAFRKGMKELSVSTPAGIYLGQATSYSVDLGRLNRVICRVIRGLFFHHTDRILDGDYRAISYAIEGIDGSSAENVAALRSVIQPLLLKDPIVIGQNVFSYRFQIVEDDDNASGWLLSIYEKVHFLGITVPKRGKPTSP